MNSKSVLLVTIFIFLFSTPAKAQGNDLLSIGIGYYGINDTKGAANFRLEYRWDIPLIGGIKPWAGAEILSSGSVYGVGGILANIRIDEHFLVTPSFGAGLYSDGGGKDLGNIIEFRSQLELGYEFDGSSRIGIAGGHISNAGLDDKNPGTEFLSLYYHRPVDWF